MRWPLTRGRRPLTRMGVRNGVLTVERLDTHATVSLPWPPPPLPEGRMGFWAPVVMARHPDGTATGLWHWEDAVPGRADEPPL
jgi:hypothetical protein